MKAEKKKRCWQEIVEALKEKRTFDLEDNSNGYRTVHWLIAEHILQNYKFSTGYKMLLQKYAIAVERNLGYAVKMLKESYHIPVYKGLKDSRRITFITLDKTYRDAREHDRGRLIERIRTHVIAGIEEGGFKGYSELTGSFSRLLLLGSKQQDAKD